MSRELRSAVTREMRRFGRRAQRGATRAGAEVGGGNLERRFPPPFFCQHLFSLVQKTPPINQPENRQTQSNNSSPRRPRPWPRPPASSPRRAAREERAERPPRPRYRDRDRERERGEEREKKRFCSFFFLSLLFRPRPAHHFLSFFSHSILSQTTKTTRTTTEVPQGPRHGIQARPQRLGK